jgi:hypothetical protein
MSRKIFLDVEEALAREVRRITFQDARTIDKVAFRETYDPFTGELIKRPIEPSFYDSSADASSIQYPHFFIRLMRSREDRFSGREVPLYGKYCYTTQTFSPKSYEIITQATDGFINSVGNTLTTGILKISIIQPGNLLRVLEGNNKGTYIVDTIIKDALGNHSINVSNTLVNTLPAFNFDSTSRTVVFSDPVDLSTLKVGDVFTDSDSATFNITAVDADNGQFVIDGATEPSIASGGSVSRTGDVFTATDPSALSFLIMDADKPVSRLGGDTVGSSVNVAVNPEVPIDAYYMIRIDSKTKDNHTMILNRMWEEFNPPRTALPVIARTALSAEAELTADVAPGGSDTISIAADEMQDFNIGDPVFIFDDLTPSKRTDGEGFERPLEGKIIGKPSSTELQLDIVVPDTFITSRCAKIVSNADFKLFMFHFVDHNTKDVEGAQYWVHEFVFWAQFYVDRQGEATEVTTVNTVQNRLEANDPDVEVDAQYIYDDIDSF